MDSSEGLFLGAVLFAEKASPSLSSFSTSLFLQSVLPSKVAGTRIQRHFDCRPMDVLESDAP